jgi:polynucleotide 5'-kinase involved in rRNA processing
VYLAEAPIPFLSPSESPREEAERRREERERRRQEKEKRRLEKEKRRQIKLKHAADSLIKVHASRNSINLGLLNVVLL